MLDGWPPPVELRAMEVDLNDPARVYQFVLEAAARARRGVDSAASGSALAGLSTEQLLAMPTASLPESRCGARLHSPAEAEGGAGDAWPAANPRAPDPWRSSRGDDAAVQAAQVAAHAHSSLAPALLSSGTCVLQASRPTIVDTAETCYSSVATYAAVRAHLGGCRGASPHCRSRLLARNAAAAMAHAPSPTCSPVSARGDERSPNVPRGPADPVVTAFGRAATPTVGRDRRPPPPRNDRTARTGAREGVALVPRRPRPVAALPPADPIMSAFGTSAEPYVPRAPPPPPPRGISPEERAAAAEYIREQHRQKQKQESSLQSKSGTAGTGGLGGGLAPRPPTLYGTSFGAPPVHVAAAAAAAEGRAQARSVSSDERRRAREWMAARAAAKVTAREEEEAAEAARAARVGGGLAALRERHAAEVARRAETERIARAAARAEAHARAEERRRAATAATAMAARDAAAAAAARTEELAERARVEAREIAEAGEELRAVKEAEAAAADEGEREALAARAEVILRCRLAEAAAGGASFPGGISAELFRPVSCLEGALGGAASGGDTERGLVSRANIGGGHGEGGGDTGAGVVPVAQLPLLLDLIDELADQASRADTGGGQGAGDTGAGDFEADTEGGDDGDNTDGGADAAGKSGDRSLPEPLADVSGCAAAAADPAAAMCPPPVPPRECGRPRQPAAARPTTAGASFPVSAAATAAVASHAAAARPSVAASVSTAIDTLRLPTRPRSRPDSSLDWWGREDVARTRGREDTRGCEEVTRARGREDVSWWGREEVARAKSLRMTAQALRGALAQGSNTGGEGIRASDNTGGGRGARDVMAGRGAQGASGASDDLWASAAARVRATVAAAAAAAPAPAELGSLLLSLEGALERRGAERRGASRAGASRAAGVGESRAVGVVGQGAEWASEIRVEDGLEGETGKRQTSQCGVHPGREQRPTAANSSDATIAAQGREMLWEASAAAEASDGAEGATESGADAVFPGVLLSGPGRDVSVLEDEAEQDESGVEAWREMPPGYASSHLPPGCAASLRLVAARGSERARASLVPQARAPALCLPVSPPEARPVPVSSPTERSLIGSPPAERHFPVTAAAASGHSATRHVPAVSTEELAWQMIRSVERAARAEGAMAMAGGGRKGAAKEGVILTERPRGAPAPLPPASADSDDSAAQPSRCRHDLAGAASAHFAPPSSPPSDDPDKRWLLLADWDSDEPIDKVAHRRRLYRRLRGGAGDMLNPGPTSESPSSVSSGDSPPPVHAAAHSPAQSPSSVSSDDFPPPVHAGTETQAQSAAQEAASDPLCCEGACGMASAEGGAETQAQAAALPPVHAAAPPPVHGGAPPLVHATAPQQAQAEAQTDTPDSLSCDGNCGMAASSEGGAAEGVTSHPFPPADAAALTDVLEFRQCERARERAAEGGVAERVTSVSAGQRHPCAQGQARPASLTRAEGEERAASPPPPIRHLETAAAAPPLPTPPSLAHPAEAPIASPLLTPPSLAHLRDPVEAARRRAAPAAHRAQQADLAATIARVEQRMARSPSASFGRDARFAPILDSLSSRAHGASSGIASATSTSGAPPGISLDTAAVAAGLRATGGCARGIGGAAGMGGAWWTPGATTGSGAASGDGGLHWAAASAAPHPDSVLAVLARMMRVEPGPEYLAGAGAQALAGTGAQSLAGAGVAPRAGDDGTRAAGNIPVQGEAGGIRDVWARGVQESSQLGAGVEAWAGATASYDQACAPPHPVGAPPAPSPDTRAPVSLDGTDPALIAEAAAAELRAMRAAARRILTATAARTGVLTSAAPPAGISSTRAPACIYDAPAPAGIPGTPAPAGIYGPPPGGMYEDAPAAYFSRLAATAIARRPAGAADGRRSAAELARMLKAELELNESLATTEKEIGVMRDRHLAEARAEEPSVAAALMASQQASQQSSQEGLAVASVLSASESIAGGSGGGVVRAASAPPRLASGLLPPLPDWRHRQRMELESMQQQLLRQRQAQADRCASLQASMADQSSETRYGGGAPPQYSTSSCDGLASRQFAPPAATEPATSPSLQQLAGRAAASCAAVLCDGGGGCGCGQPAARTVFAPHTPSCALPHTPTNLVVATPAPEADSGGCGWAGRAHAPGRGYRLIIEGPPHATPHVQEPAIPATSGLAPVAALQTHAQSTSGHAPAIPGTSGLAPASAPQAHAQSTSGHARVAAAAAQMHTQATNTSHAAAQQTETQPPVSYAAAADAATMPSPTAAAAAAAAGHPAEPPFALAESPSGPASQRSESRSAQTEPDESRSSAPAGAGLHLQYEVEVPSSVPEGGCFAAHVGGELRLIEVPHGARDGVAEGAPLRLLVAAASLPPPPPPPPPPGLWVVEVPPHLRPGDAFTANVGGTIMQVRAPDTGGGALGGADDATAPGFLGQRASPRLALDTAVGRLRGQEAAGSSLRVLRPSARRRSSASGVSRRLGRRSTGGARGGRDYSSSFSSTEPEPRLDLVDWSDATDSTSAGSSLRPPPRGAIIPWGGDLGGAPGVPVGGAPAAPEAALSVERALLALLLEERAAAGGANQLSSQVLANITNLAGPPPVSSDATTAGGGLAGAVFAGAAAGAERERALEAWRREDAAAEARAVSELRAARKKERERAKAARNEVARTLRRERERQAAAFRGEGGSVGREVAAALTQPAGAAADTPTEAETEAEAVARGKAEADGSVALGGAASLTRPSTSTSLEAEMARCIRACHTCPSAAGGASAAELTGAGGVAVGGVAVVGEFASSSPGARLAGSMVACVRQWQAAQDQAAAASAAAAAESRAAKDAPPAAATVGVPADTSVDMSMDASLDVSGRQHGRGDTSADMSLDVSRTSQGRADASLDVLRAAERGTGAASAAAASQRGARDPSLSASIVEDSYAAGLSASGRAGLRQTGGARVGGSVGEISVGAEFLIGESMVGGSMVGESMIGASGIEESMVRGSLAGGSGIDESMTRASRMGESTIGESMTPGSMARGSMIGESLAGLSVGCEATADDESVQDEASFAGASASGGVRRGARVRGRASAEACETSIGESFVVEESEAGEVSDGSAGSDTGGGSRVGGVSSSLIASLVETGVLLSATGDYLPRADSPALSEVESFASDLGGTAARSTLSVGYDSCVDQISMDLEATSGAISGVGLCASAISIADEIGASSAIADHELRASATSIADEVDASGWSPGGRRQSSASAGRVGGISPPEDLFTSPPEELFTDDSGDDEPPELASELARLAELRARLQAKKAQAVGVLQAAIDSERLARARAAIAAEEAELVAQLEESERIIAAGQARLAAAGARGWVESMVEEEEVREESFVLVTSTTEEEGSVRSESGAFGTVGRGSVGASGVGVADEVGSEIGEVAEVDDEITSQIGEIGEVVDEITSQIGEIAEVVEEAGSEIGEIGEVAAAASYSGASDLGAPPTEPTPSPPAVVAEFGRRVARQPEIEEGLIADEMESEDEIEIEAEGEWSGGEGEGREEDAGGEQWEGVAPRQTATEMDGTPPNLDASTPELDALVLSTAESALPASHAGAEPAPARSPVGVPSSPLAPSRPQLFAATSSHCAGPPSAQPPVAPPSAPTRLAAGVAASRAGAAASIGATAANMVDRAGSQAAGGAGSDVEVDLEEEILEEDSIAELGGVVEAEEADASAAAEKAGARSAAVAAQAAARAAVVERQAAERAAAAEGEEAAARRAVAAAAFEHAAAEQAAAEQVAAAQQVAAGAQRAVLEHAAAAAAATERAAAERAEEERRADALTSTLAQALIQEAVASAASAIRAKAKRRSDAAAAPVMTPTPGPPLPAMEVSGEASASVPAGAFEAAAAAHIPATHVSTAAGVSPGAHASAEQTRAGFGRASGCVQTGAGDIPQSGLAIDAAAQAEPITEALLEDLLREIGSEVLRQRAAAAGAAAAPPASGIPLRTGGLPAAAPAALVTPALAPGAASLPVPASLPGPVPLPLPTPAPAPAPAPLPAAASPKSPRSPVSPTRAIALQPPAATSSSADGSPQPLTQMASLPRFGSTAASPAAPLPPLSGVTRPSQGGSSSPLLPPVTGNRASGAALRASSSDYLPVPTGADAAASLVASLRVEAQERGEQGFTISSQAFEAALAQLLPALDGARPAVAGRSAGAAGGVSGAAAGEAGTEATQHLRAWARLLWAASNEAASRALPPSGHHAAALAPHLATRRQREAHARMLAQMAAVAASSSSVSGGVPLPEAAQCEMTERDLAETHEYAEARRRYEERAVCAAVADAVLARLIGELVVEMGGAAAGRDD